MAGGEFGETVSLDFCLEPTEVAGCTDPSAANYNPAATLDDGSCIAAVLGCTTSAACNYNPDANVEDGSCEFPVQYYSCDDICISDEDGDGVCDQLEVAGCQDDTACNYDEAATDPGTCFYPDDGYNCDGSPLCLEDLNVNGAIDVGDVLMVLSEFGCQSECTADVTGDGLVVVDDILVVLAVFGVVCQ